MHLSAGPWPAYRFELLSTFGALAAATEPKAPSILKLSASNITTSTCAPPIFLIQSRCSSSATYSTLPLDPFFSTASEARTRPVLDRHCTDTWCGESRSMWRGSNYAGSPLATAPRSTAALTDSVSCYKNSSRPIFSSGFSMTTRESFREVSTAARFARCWPAASSACPFSTIHPAPFHRSLQKCHNFCVTDAIDLPAISTTLDEPLNLDEKDAEPLGNKPKGSGEEVFSFSDQGRGDRQPAFGVPPSLTTDPAPDGDRTENPQLVQYFQESPNSDQNRLIEGVWDRVSMASSTA